MENNEIAVKKGKLITICGMERCQINERMRILSETLQMNGQQIYVKEQVMYSLCNNFDSSEESFFEIAKSNIKTVTEEFSEKLNEGYTVICEGYLYYFIAHMIAKGSDNDQIQSLSEAFLNPDLAIFLNLPIECASDKNSNAENNNCDFKFEKKIHDLYIKIAREYNGMIISALLPDDILNARLAWEVNKVIR